MRTSADYEGWGREELIKELQDLYQRLVELEESERVRRQLEAKYRVKCLRLQALMDSTTDIVIFKARDSEYLACNEAYARLLGKHAAELVGKSDRDFFARDVADRFRAEDLEVMTALQPRTYENLLDTPSGKRWFESVKLPVYDDVGELMGVLCTGRDITERKEFEVALRQSEQKYRLLVENSGVAITLMDRDGRYLFVNEITASMLGRKPDDFVGKNIAEFLPGEVVQRFMGRLQRVIDTGVGMDYEIPLTLAEREWWLRINIQPVVGGDGAISAALIIALDITERMNAERALRDSEARYRAIVEDQTELICRFLPGGELTFVNEAYCRYFGKTREELLGRTFFPLVHPEDVGIPEAALSSLSLEQPVDSVEHRVLLPNGKAGWMRWTNRAIFDEEGHLVEIQAVGQDVSEKKRAERLRREHVRGLNVLSRTALGLIQLTNDDDIYRFIAKQLLQLIDDEVILIINSFDSSSERFTVRVLLGLDDELPEVRRVLGKDPVGTSFLLGQEAREAYSEGKLTHVSGGLYELTSGAILRDACRELENRLRLSNVYAMPFSLTGNLFGSVVILQRRPAGGKPIQLRNQKLIETLINGAALALQRRRAEEMLREREQQLRQAQKMEALGRLASGIAHDFDNILANIMGYASLLRMRLPSESQLNQQLDVIIRQCHRASDMTAELLSFAQGGVVPLVPVNVNEVVDEVVESLWERVDDAVEVKTCLTEGPAVIRGDVSQLHRAVLNLCLNAHDAIMAVSVEQRPDGHEIRIETAIVQLDEAAAHELNLAPGPYVRLSVSDTGVGMDDETMRRAFDPFFTTKEGMKNHRHSGLGLSTVYAVVQSHGGAVKMGSVPGSGVTVHLFLPAENSVDGAVCESSVSYSGRGAILVVDEDLDSLNLTRDVLEETGYRVLAASDGQAGLTAVQEQGEAIDLVVLDWLGPPLTTPETFRRMRALRDDLKVMLVSSARWRKAMLELVGSGAVAYLQKPYDPVVLCRQVGEAIAER